MNVRYSPVPITASERPRFEGASATGMAADGPVNAMTVDVEDYFQVSAMAPYIHRRTWDDRPCRVEGNVYRLLDLFESHQARATFFTLGWIAQRYPRLVHAIGARGHEVASHGFDHRRVGEQSRAEFASDVKRAKQVLEDQSGHAVLGYRAPSFSIGHDTTWAFDALLEAGYRYTSSVYPVRHDHYGVPDAPRFPYSPRPGLIEIPITTARCLGRNLPAGGGGYFRLAPYAVSRWALRRVNTVDRRPAVFYLHPWEVDPDQPRIDGVGLKTRFRHYLNLRRMESRLSRLLDDFRWDRVDRVFERVAAP